jgi:hypothetical protein
MMKPRLTTRCLTMQRLNYMLAAAAGPAACAPHTAHAAGTEVLSEDFSNLADATDWVRINRSDPPGASWHQGNPDVFPAHTGAPGAYVAASCLSAANGVGRVDNWLITPTLTLSGLTTLSFFTSRERVDGFDDLLEVRFGRGSGTAAASFDTLLASIGGATDFPAQWQPWLLDLTVDGTGRFAFRYLGDAARLSHIGLDTVRVVTRLPEPTSRLLLADGLGVLGLLRRHERH